jgi:5-methylcytosine-specific restriction endonuclease McrA
VTQRHSPEYQTRIRSAEWRKLRQELILRARHRCQRCQTLSPALSVHHLTYERLGRELLSDLVVVCTLCHEALDRIRQEESRRRQEAQRAQAHWDARVEAWAEKKYGNTDYFDSHDWDRVEEEFEEWLDSRGDW